MKLGYCPACNSKIGFRTANGVFRWDKQKIAQIGVVFGYEGRTETTTYHVVICKECAKTKTWNDIEPGIQSEPNYASFKRAAPNARYLTIVEDLLQ